MSGIFNSFEKYAIRGDILSRAKGLPTGNDPLFSSQQAVDKNPTKPMGTSSYIPPKPKLMSLDDGYKQWTTSRNPHNMSELLRAAKPVIDSSIKTYANIDSPVLRTQAKQLAIQAIKNYDPNQGVPLKNYMMQHMRGLYRINAQRSPMVVPERVRLDGVRIAAALNEFKESNGREPTMDELADSIKLSKKRIAYVQKLDRPVVAESQLTGVDEDENENTPDVYLPGAAEESRENTLAAWVYHDLSTLDKQIYNMYLGREGYPRDMTVAQMASKLRMSAPAVSQRARRIDTELRKAVGNPE